MSTVSGITTFDAAGVTFCGIPEGDALIGDTELGQTPERVHVGRFGLAQKPGCNSELAHYAKCMKGLTHGRVACRISDGRPFVVERTRADGSGSQPGVGFIAFNESSSVLVDGGRLVRLVPDPNRYVKMLGERAVHFIGPHRPATFMTPLESLGWTDFLAQQSVRDVTLPTPIQWEYAAQGGQGHCYAPHGKLDPSKVIYNHDGKREGPAPLNRDGWQELLNPFGLLDMTGNVSEPTLFECPITTPKTGLGALWVLWCGGKWYSDHEILLRTAYGVRGPGFADSGDGVRPAVVLP
jgi:formylglycine-generating enzyme required for sulfatase activity